MVDEEIVGGIKNALERGDSLKDAMISFFNAGYDRKEIEEAAAILLNYPTTSIKEIKIPSPEVKNLSVIDENKKSIQKVSKYGEEEIPPAPIIPISINRQPEMEIGPSFNSSKFVPKELPKAAISPTQVVKKIEKQKGSSNMTSSEKTMIGILVGLLLFLVGILVSIFLFRQQLINFISNLVS